MSAPAPAPLDILRARLAPLNTSTSTNGNTSSPGGSAMSPYPRSGLTDPTLALPTPPPETALPAKDATVYLPTPLHPDVIKYARERFGRVIMPREMELGQAMALADGIGEWHGVSPQSARLVFPWLHDEAGLGSDLDLGLDSCFLPPATCHVSLVTCSQYLATQSRSHQGTQLHRTVRDHLDLFLP